MSKANILQERGFEMQLQEASMDALCVEVITRIQKMRDEKHIPNHVIDRVTISLTDDEITIGFFDTAQVYTFFISDI